MFSLRSVRLWPHATRYLNGPPNQSLSSIAAGAGKHQTPIVDQLWRRREEAKVALCCLFVIVCRLSLSVSLFCLYFTFIVFCLTFLCVVLRRLLVLSLSSSLSSSWSSCRYLCFCVRLCRNPQAARVHRQSGASSIGDLSVLS